MIQGSSPLDIRRPQRRGGGAGSFAPPSLTVSYTTVCGAVCLECLAVLHDRTVGDGRRALASLGKTKSPSHTAGTYGRDSCV
jgi:hypothetical protein